MSKNKTKVTNNKVTKNKTGSKAKNLGYTGTTNTKSITELQNANKQLYKQLNQKGADKKAINKQIKDNQKLIKNMLSKDYRSNKHAQKNAYKTENAREITKRTLGTAGSTAGTMISDNVTTAAYTSGGHTVSNNNLIDGTQKSTNKSGRDNEDDTSWEDTINSLGGFKP